MTKPWEGNHFKELMERHQPFYSDDNSIDDVVIIEALQKDWEEQFHDEKKAKSFTSAKWISITERLPDKHDVVLVSDGRNITVAMAYYNNNQDFSWQVKTNRYDRWDEDGYDIRFWAELPKPPRNDK